MIEYGSRFVARVVTGVMSLLHATSLRDRLFRLKDEHERMWTALDDIARMHPNEPVGEAARKTLANVETTYGRKQVPINTPLQQESTNGTEGS